MTNTHRKTTTSTTAKIAAVGAFGIGAAIAFPGLAAAQDGQSPTADTGTLENIAGEDGSLENPGGEDGSLEDLTGEDGSLEGALDTDLNLELGSLALNLNLDAEAPTPGSVEFGSVGVSPNTGSELIDGSLGDTDADDDGDNGSLDLGSLTEGSADEGTDDATNDDDTTGSLSAVLAGLGSENEDDGTTT